MSARRPAARWSPLRQRASFRSRPIADSGGRHPFRLRSLDVVQAEVLYDAARANAPLGGLLIPLFFGVMGAMALAVIARPDLGKGPDATMTRVGATAFLLGACLGIGLCLLPTLAGVWPGVRTRINQTTLVQGCVRNFERDVHPNGHGMTDTYFRVANRDYHFNSSPWWPGFHDDDDLIHPADRLRLLMSGQRVIRIEKLAAGCA